MLVTFKTAKLAKEKGFNINCNNCYIVDNGKLLSENNYLGKCISAPTQSELQKWLREEHNIHIKIDDFLDDETGTEWDYEIVIIGTDLDERGNYTPLISYDMSNSMERKFKTYENALEEGLFEALKLIPSEISVDSIFGEEKMKKVEDFVQKHKEETVEEAAERAIKSGLFKDKTLFIAGVKWQSERSFSYEQVYRMTLEALDLGMQIRQDQLNGYYEKSGKELHKEWFENYKK